MASKTTWRAARIEGIWCVVDGAGRVLAEIHGPRARSIAHLISAAPDLHASLTEALECLVWDQRDLELRRARAALAKAKPTIRKI